MFGKGEPREFKSLEIAIWASIWTAFIILLTSGLMILLLTQFLVVPGSQESEGQRGTPAIGGTGELELKIKLANTDALELPVRLKPPAEVVEIPAMIKAVAAPERVRVPLEVIASAPLKLPVQWQPAEPSEDPTDATLKEDLLKGKPKIPTTKEAFEDAELQRKTKPLPPPKK